MNKNELPKVRMSQNYDIYIISGLFFIMGVILYEWLKILN